MMELGSIEQDIAKQALRSGQPLPDRISNAPSLKLGLSLYLQAFFDLDAERSQGMGAGRIPWSATLRYGMYYELDEEQIEMLFHFVKIMDTAYLKYRAEGRER